MNDLAIFTTEELVNELISRPTFAGVVIRSAQEVKFPSQHTDWNISFQNLTLEQVHVILKEITDLIGAEI